MYRPLASYLLTSFAAPSNSNFTTVGNHRHQSLNPSMQEDISRLESEFRHGFALTQREEATTVSQRFREKVSLPSFHEIHEASLGKFTATTATFSWPSLKPSSKLEDPCMFRNFGKASTLSEYKAWSPSSSCPSPPPTSHCTTPISECGSLERTRSEYENEAIDEDHPSDIFHDSMIPLGSIRVIRTRKELFDDAHSCSSYNSDRTTSRYSSLPKVEPPRKTPLPPIITDFSSSTTASQGSTSPSSPDSTAKVKAPRNSNSSRKWEEFAVHVGSNKYLCLWPGETCEYLAKKQLVKRHVETKHMKLKPFICPFCRDRFPQKTSMNVHVASKQFIVISTRSKPYKCPFDGCQQAYNDPARLHRHKIDVHKYVPKATIRCKKRSRVSSPSSDYDLTTGTSQ
ncbi:hypothetical protein C8J55DRAFT_560064 [Lentinula edodes]|uniref:C2H2-type domain-containing protein n=1 Tax=Lentinula lateritia TaxID=40482 RepID=A0A9W9AFC5_9AGAR|nr:hypothetical protein C8J55DRAFT_560064 [Lentinula edodes]